MTSVIRSEVAPNGDVIEVRWKGSVVQVLRYVNGRGEPRHVGTAYNPEDAIEIADRAKAGEVG